jgi:hypothetical protein
MFMDIEPAEDEAPLGGAWNLETVGLTARMAEFIPQRGSLVTVLRDKSRSPDRLLIAPGVYGVLPPLDGSSKRRY